MPHQRTVRDLMIPIAEYPTVREEALVRDAISVLRETMEDPKGHRAVLMVDEKDNAVGILTFRDLVQALEPPVLSADIPQGSIGWLLDDIDPQVYPEGFFTKRSQSEAGKTVREIMKQLDLITIQADAPLLKAVHTMVHYCIGSLPVLDGDRVVGMIQINEIFGEIASVLTQNQ